MASTTSAACCVSSAFASAAAQAVPKNGALAMAAIPPRSNSSRLRLDCRESSRVQSVVVARPKFVPSSVAVRRTKKFLVSPHSSHILISAIRYNDNSAFFPVIGHPSSVKIYCDLRLVQLAFLVLLLLAFQILS